MNVPMKHAILITIICRILFCKQLLLMEFHFGHTKFTERIVLKGKNVKNLKLQ